MTQNLILFELPISLSDVAHKYVLHPWQGAVVPRTFAATTGLLKPVQQFRGVG